MKNFPPKVSSALTNIDTTLSSLTDRKKRGNSIGAFTVYDTLFSFQGAILRSIGKVKYHHLTIAIRTAMATYAYYIDDPTDEKFEELDDLIKATRKIISELKT